MSVSAAKLRPRAGEPTEAFRRTSVVALALLVAFALMLSGCVVAPGYVIDEFRSNDRQVNDYELRAEHDDG